MAGFGENINSNKKNLSNGRQQYDENEILKKAINFHYEGNILRASKLYQFLIEKGSKNSTIFTNYGLTLINFGKLKEAEFIIRKSIELNPKDAIAHYNLGGILKKQKKLKEAKFFIEKSIELNPKDAIAHYNLGIILKEVGKLQESEQSYRKAIKIKSDYSEAYYNLGIILKELGKLQESEQSYRKAIKIKSDYSEAYYNLGIVLKELGKLQESEQSYRKAIKIKPTYVEAHFNLGNLLANFGKLQESKQSYRKAIELNPNYMKAYYSLSLLQYSDKNEIWKNLLFSKSVLNHKSKDDQINIYFARANILHKEKNYEGSSKFLNLANQLKLNQNPSNSDSLINKSEALLLESNEEEINKKEYSESKESIFIVGMPRSGSTLLESILSINPEVYDLGESDIFEESFLDYKKDKQNLNLAEIYWKKIKNHNIYKNKTTNKNLYNYLYTGIIANDIPNAKIIHCYRNPLDNILSIYRAHFTRGNQYSSSLMDCAKVYLNQDMIMNTYKSRYRSQIYDLNYESLVSNPEKEIRSLIIWLCWDWSDAYLSPHLNQRSVFTASNIQVRSPINSKSIGGWRNYKDMLKPSIEILKKEEKYRNLLL